jgi:hypothetical protein
MAFEDQHRQAFALSEEVAVEGAETKVARRRLHDALRPRDRQQLKEIAIQLHQAVVGPPGVLGPRRRGEAESGIARRGRLEVADAEYQVVDSALHGSVPRKTITNRLAAGKMQKASSALARLSLFEP